VYSCDYDDKFLVSESTSTYVLTSRRTLIRFDADAVINGVPETLLAAEVPLRRLDAHVTQQKLNLLQLATGLVTKARARSSTVPHAA
jgi:hypothetical protein